MRKEKGTFEQDWEGLGKFQKMTADDSICNHPIQGSAADGFKSALIDLDSQIVHILHDEIIVEAREDIAFVDLGKQLAGNDMDA